LNKYFCTTQYLTQFCATRIGNESDLASPSTPSFCTGNKVVSRSETGTGKGIRHSGQWLSGTRDQGTTHKQFLQVWLSVRLVAGFATIIFEDGLGMYFSRLGIRHTAQVVACGWCCSERQLVQISMAMAIYFLFRSRKMGRTRYLWSIL
jgi:hypothetical protein